MNPLTNVKNITKLNEIELTKGTKKSWHDMYKDSAWIFIGGLAYGLTEGDILAVFSQYGEIVNINLVRDKKTGKIKGFCFLCYANQKSTRLAVDNLNGIKLCNRTIRVDHVSNYKPPKEDDRDDELTKMLKSEGCAPGILETNERSATQESTEKKIKKKLKKEKKEQKKKRKKCDDSEDTVSMDKKIRVKEEKHDSGYDKYDLSSHTRKNTFEEIVSQARNCEKFGEGSSSHIVQKSETNDQIHRSKIKPSERENRRYISSSIDSNTLKGKDRQEHRQHKHNKKNYDRKCSHKSKKSTKRRSSSSSSDDSTENSSSKDNVKYKVSHSQSKKIHRHNDFKYASHSQLPPDYRRVDIEKEIYEKIKQETSDEDDEYQQKNSGRYDSRREHSLDRAFSRSRHDETRQRHSEYKHKKTNYRDEENYDSHSSGSHKNKYEKR